MKDTNELLIDSFDARVERRNERRDFFKAALGATAVAAAGAGALGWASQASAQAVTDADVLNFALNLEYLEAQFYSHAYYGDGLSPDMQTGTGRQGMAIGGRAVNFSSAAVRAYAKEIAQDEVNHVNFLRGALGDSAVAQPTVDIGVTPTSAFSVLAQAAKIVGPGEAFDVYANDLNFLLGSYVFEDVGVTAYKGAAPLLTNKTYLEAAAGILAVEAYHASIIRTTLYTMGATVPTARTYADDISDARDSVDGKTDDDQGISVDPNTAGASNIVPLDANGIAYSRTVQQVHNVVYLTPDAASMGGFFPNGTNGTLTMSGDSSKY